MEQEPRSKPMRVRLSHLVFASLVCAVALAQGPKVDRGSATLTLDGKTISVDYGRPSYESSLGEGTFEDLLAKLPADRMWRAGANQVTTLSTELDLMIGGTKVPAGKYSLYVHCPETGEYSLVLNSVLGQPLVKVWAEAPPELKEEPWPHFKYTEEIGDQEVVRAPMKMMAATEPADLFTVDLKEKDGGAVMTLSWGEHRWAIPIEVVE
jgi:hypothetical protein